MSQKSPTLYEKADRWVVRIIRFISYISAICLVAIMLVAFFNVLGEKIRQIPKALIEAGWEAAGNFLAPLGNVTGIPASQEIIQYLHIPVVFLAAAFVTLDRGHTRIDLISSKFPPMVQEICTTIGHICGAAICGFISYRGFIRMQTFLERNKMSSVNGVGFPLWPFALVMAVGFALLTISFVWAIVRQYAAPHKDEKPEGGEQ